MKRALKIFILISNVFLISNIYAKVFKTKSRFPSSQSKLEYEMKGIIRGPTSEKKLAIIFTAHDEIEGMDSFLSSLKSTNTTASFFLGGAFFKKENLHLFQRILKEKYYIGPHSDTHATFANEDGKTLVDFKFFQKDVAANIARIKQWGYTQPSGAS